MKFLSYWILGFCLTTPFAYSFDQIAYRTFYEYSGRYSSFSPQGDLLVSGSEDGSIQLWDAKSGEFQARLGEQLQLPAWAATITSLAYSHGGELVAAGNNGGVIQVWNVRTKEVIRVFSHASSVHALEFSQDDRFLVSGGTDRQVEIWDLQDGTRLQEFKHSASISSAVFSTDGKEILVQGFDTSLGVWDLKSGKRTGSKDGDSNSTVYTSIVAKDRKVLVSAVHLYYPSQHIIQVRSLGTGQLIRTLEGHTNEVVSLSLSADGKILASGSSDKTVRVWNMETGDLIKVLEHRDSVRSVALSPDGSMIFVGTGLDDLTIWKK